MGEGIGGFRGNTTWTKAVPKLFIYYPLPASSPPLSIPHSARLRHTAFAPFAAVELEQRR